VVLGTTILGTVETLVEAVAMAEMTLRIRVESQVKLGAPPDTMEKLTRKFIRMGGLEVPVKLKLGGTRPSFSLELCLLHFPQFTIR
jgi:hypothetical protein